MNLRNVFILLVIVLATAAVTYLSFPYMNDHVVLGLDIKGGSHFDLQAVPSKQVKVITKDKMEQAKAVIENRVRGTYGGMEPVVQLVGSDRLSVDIPGETDTAKVQEEILKNAYLEIYPTDANGKKTDSKPLIAGDELASAKEGYGGNGGTEIVINFTLKKEAAKKWADYTSTHIGETYHLGTFLDGKMIINPYIAGAMPDGRGEIQMGSAAPDGQDPFQYAHDIAVRIMSGTVPVQLDVISSNTVGPSLGADLVHKSLWAGAGGVIVVLLFMLVLYRVSGLVADFALVVYGILLLASLVAFGATLTLPGIAGFLLSIGMAVDTNILIFERFKEEVRTGKTLRSAMDAGFKRALTAILDSHVTTFIAAFILYYFGTAAVKGFGLTLMIGIALSLFTAVVVSRWMLFLTVNANFTRKPWFYGGGHAFGDHSIAQEVAR